MAVESGQFDRRSAERIGRAVIGYEHAGEDLAGVAARRGRALVETCWAQLGEFYAFPWRYSWQEVQPTADGMGWQVTPAGRSGINAVDPIRIDSTRLTGAIVLLRRAWRPGEESESGSASGSSSSAGGQGFDCEWHIVAPPRSFWGIVQAEGSSSSSSGATPLYWIKRAHVSNTGGMGDALTEFEADEAAFGEGDNSYYLSVMATNVAEAADSHQVAAGTPVRVWLDYDRSSPSCPRYSFSHGGGAAAGGPGNGDIFSGMIELTQATAKTYICAENFQDCEFAIHGWETDAYLSYENSLSSPAPYSCAGGTYYFGHSIAAGSSVVLASAHWFGSWEVRYEYTTGRLYIIASGSPAPMQIYWKVVAGARLAAATQTI